MYYYDVEYTLLKDGQFVRRDNCGVTSEKERPSDDELIKLVDKEQAGPKSAYNEVRIEATEQLDESAYNKLYGPLKDQAPDAL